jgi:hypothetical protein
MVAGDIDYPAAVGKKLKDLLYYCHVNGGEIVFAELPAVYDIAIKDQ